MELDFHSKFRECISRMEKIGNEYAEARGQSYQMQELKGSVLASVFKSLGDVPATRGEMQAKDSNDYRQHILETAQAITKELKLKSQYEKEKCVFEALRSLSSLEKKIVERTQV